MRLIKVMVVCAVVQLCSAKWREIVANEEELANTCMATCEKIGVIDHQPNMLKRNCQIVKECKTMTHGWTKGFVRCDYCKCKCEDTRAVIPQLVQYIYDRQFSEHFLYGTCTGTCSRSGLVRTNFDDCHEVRDCGKDKNKILSKGWLRGSERCHYCRCQCVYNKYAASYELIRLKYKLDDNALTVGKPTAIKHTYLENLSGQTQTLKRTISFSYTNSMSISTTQSLTTGLPIVVESGFDLGKALGNAAITTSIKAGYSSTVDGVTETSHTDTIEAKMDVGPGQQCRTVVVGNVMDINVPYTATLYTWFDDGSWDYEETEGVFSGVETSQFRVEYNECTQRN